MKARLAMEWYDCRMLDVRRSPWKNRVKGAVGSYVTWWHAWLSAFDALMVSSLWVWGQRLGCSFIYIPIGTYICIPRWRLSLHHWRGESYHWKVKSHRGPVWIISSILPPISLRYQPHSEPWEVPNDRSLVFGEFLLRGLEATQEGLFIDVMVV